MNHGAHSSIRQSGHFAIELIEFASVWIQCELFFVVHPKHTHTNVYMWKRNIFFVYAGNEAKENLRNFRCAFVVRCICRIEGKSSKKKRIRFIIGSFCFQSKQQQTKFHQSNLLVTYTEKALLHAPSSDGQELSRVCAYKKRTHKKSSMPMIYFGMLYTFSSRISVVSAEANEFMRFSHQAKVNTNKSSGRESERVEKTSESHHRTNELRTLVRWSIAEIINSWLETR